MATQEQVAAATRTATHGLTIKLKSDAVVRGESKQEFETILNALLSDATLGTAQEILLIPIQAEGYWKMERARSMESGALGARL